MSWANAAEAAFMDLYFNNVAWSNLGNAGGVLPSTVAGSIYVALATGAYTGASTQLTNEAAYVGYLRVAVARSAAGWTRSGSGPTQAANAAAVTFPTSTSGPESETHFSFGHASSGAGQVSWYGALTATLVVNNGITPSGAIGLFVGSID